MAGGTLERMDVTVTELPERRAVAVAHVGPFDQIGTAFDQLRSWMLAHADLVATAPLAIYADDPNSTPAEQLRSYAAVPIRPEAELAADGSGDAGVQEIPVPGGRYAVGVHRGSYAGLAQAWLAVMAAIDAAGLDADWSRPSFEIYATDPGTVPEDQLLTELYVPLR